ncbi:MAG: NADH-quinone oxidoreductase subunit N [Planctomycetaceae bacterium]|nr:NADH-quinone oxidoreductase subunit N [Planctomycetaceae bacterium]
MNAADVQAMLPLIVTAAAAVAVMLAIAIRRSHRACAVLAALGLAAAIGLLPVAAAAAPREISSMLMIDRFALYYIGLVLAGSLAVVMISQPYFVAVGRGGDLMPEEYYVLVLLAASGAGVLAASSHFASFLLGLEILSVSLFAMIAYRRDQAAALEAGIKYLLLAGVSSAMLVFGMALVYAARGTMHLTQLAHGGAGVLMFAGMAAMTVGIGFKLAVVPFQFWTPDVYQGSSAPVAALVATVSKGAIFALLVRYFWQMGSGTAFPGGDGATGWNANATGGPVFWTFAVIAVASMFAGNLLALQQDNVKRILAYSSIAHMGYLLVAFLAAGRLAAQAVGIYLAAYFVAKIGAFAVVAAMSNSEGETQQVRDYRGLAWRRPWLAAAMTAMLLSLAGLPLTAGFVGKFYVVAAGAGRGLWTLAVILIINSAVGLFYYLRVISEMFRPAWETDASPQAAGPDLPRVAWPTAAALCVLSAALVAIGVYPQPLLAVIGLLP